MKGFTVAKGFRLSSSSCWFRGDNTLVKRAQVLGQRLQQCLGYVIAHSLNCVSDGAPSEFWRMVVAYVQNNAVQATGPESDAAVYETC